MNELARDGPLLLGAVTLPGRGVVLRESLLRLERSGIELHRRLQGALRGVELPVPQIQVGLDQVAFDGTLRHPDGGFHRRARTPPQLCRLGVELRRALQVGLRGRVARRRRHAIDAVAPGLVVGRARAALLPKTRRLAGELIGPGGAKARVQVQGVRIVSRELQDLVGQRLRLVVLPQGGERERLLHDGAPVSGVERERTVGDLDRVAQLLLARFLPSKEDDLAPRLHLLAAIVGFLDEIACQLRETIGALRIRSHGILERANPVLVDLVVTQPLLARGLVHLDGECDEIRQWCPGSRRLLEVGEQLVGRSVDPLLAQLGLDARSGCPRRSRIEVRGRIDVGAGAPGITEPRCGRGSSQIRGGEIGASREGDRVLRTRGRGTPQPEPALSGGESHVGIARAGGGRTLGLAQRRLVVLAAERLLRSRDTRAGQVGAL